MKFIGWTINSFGDLKAVIQEDGTELLSVIHPSFIVGMKTWKPLQSDCDKLIFRSVFGRNEDEARQVYKMLYNEDCELALA